MTNIIRIPANTQAYLELLHDGLQDVHLIKTMQYRYQNEEAVTFPAAWGYWKMEETSGNRLDSSGNNRTLILNHPELGETGYDTGVLGNCFKATQCGYLWNLYMANGPTLGDVIPYTLCFWTKASGYSNWNAFVEITFGPYIGVYSATVGNMEYTYSDDTYIDEIITGTASDWHFVCLRYDGSATYIEVDNVQIGTDVGVHGLSGEYFFSISASNYGSCTGYLDELGIWVGDNALTADQRSQLYNSGAGWSPY